MSFDANQSSLSFLPERRHVAAHLFEIDPSETHRFKLIPWQRYRAGKFGFHLQQGAHRSGAADRVIKLDGNTFVRPAHMSTSVRVYIPPRYSSVLLDIS